MEYKLLEFEEATIEAEKYLILLNASHALEDTGYFYEDSEKKDGILKKLMEAIKRMIDKLKSIFNKNKSVGVTKEQKEILTKRKKIMKKLKSNVKNKKLWIALGGTLAVGGAFYLHKKAGDKRVAKYKRDEEERKRHEREEEKHQKDLNRVRVSFQDIASEDYAQCREALGKAYYAGEIDKETFDHACNTLISVLKDNENIIQHGVTDLDSKPDIRRASVDKNGLHIKDGRVTRTIGMNISNESLEKDKSSGNAFDIFGNRKKPNKNREEKKKEDESSKEKGLFGAFGGSSAKDETEEDRAKHAEKTLKRHKERVEKQRKDAKLRFGIDLPENIKNKSDFNRVIDTLTREAKKCDDRSDLSILQSYKFAYASIAVDNGIIDDKFAKETLEFDNYVNDKMYGQRNSKGDKSKDDSSKKEKKFDYKEYAKNLSNKHNQRISSCKDRVLKETDRLKSVFNINLPDNITNDNEYQNVIDKLMDIAKRSSDDDLKYLLSCGYAYRRLVNETIHPSPRNAKSFDSFEKYIKSRQ